MQNFLESIWAKILRLVLTAAAVIIGSLPFSYAKEIPQFNEDGSLKAVDIIRSNYFILDGNGLMDWAPLICIVLAIGALILAVVSLFKETESILTWLAQLISFAMIAQLLIIIFLSPTVWGWCMAGVLLLALVLTAVQEMRMEDKNKK